MKKNIALLILLFSVVLTGCSNEQITNPVNENTDNTKKIDNESYSSMQSKIKPDKIELIEFHNTQRCSTCLKAEELLKKTLDTKFGAEVKNGLISFKDIDIDLPENAEITNKFQASGLSVAINSISNGKDNIEYDMGGWQLVANEEQYIAYFEKKLNSLLGK